MSSNVPQLSPNLLYVQEVQRGNPVLNHIKNVKWVLNKEIVPDYVMNSTCALFVSIKFHFRHPKHILRRIDEVGRNYRLRILLVLVDDENNLTTMQELNKIAFVHNFTLIYTWSNVECARYLETWKSYENKSSISIQEREETEFLPKMSKVLTNIRSINKTDVSTLLDVFGNFTNLCKASEDQLVLCPGIGEKKVKRLYHTLHEPFQKKQKITVHSHSLSINKKVNENFMETPNSVSFPESSVSEQFHLITTSEATDNGDDKSKSHNKCKTSRDDSIDPQIINLVDD